MSLILAVDTSTDICSVALNINGQVNTLFEKAAQSHTRRVLPMVNELMCANGVVLEDLDAIAFGRGPGSFTGLRICAGIVQGLAFGASLPVIPVSTLEAIALGFYRANQHELLPLLVALDARMNEVYWGLFERNGDLVRSLADEGVTGPESLVARDEVLALNGKFVSVGPGWHYPALQVFPSPQKVLNVWPSAEDIALIAASQFAKGQVVSALEAQPVYLRDSVSWQKRQRIRDSNDFLGIDL